MIPLPDPLSTRYLEGPPDEVELLLDHDELLLFGALGVGDHLVGEGEGVHGDAVGPSVVLQHSSEEGFGGKHKFLVSLRDPGAVRIPKAPGAGAVSHTDASWGGKKGEEKEGQEMREVGMRLGWVPGEGTSGPSHEPGAVSFLRTGVGGGEEGLLEAQRPSCICCGRRGTVGPGTFTSTSPPPPPLVLAESSISSPGSKKRAPGANTRPGCVRVSPPGLTNPFATVCPWLLGEGLREEAPHVLGTAGL